MPGDFMHVRPNIGIVVASLLSGVAGPAFVWRFGR